MLKFKCGVCKVEGDYLDLFDIYMGMGITQYVCIECQKNSFKSVMKALSEDESDAYVGNIPLEDIHSSKPSAKTEEEK